MKIPLNVKKVLKAEDTFLLVEDSVPNLGIIVAEFKTTTFDMLGAVATDGTLRLYKKDSEGKHTLLSSFPMPSPEDMKDNKNDLASLLVQTIGDHTVMLLTDRISTAERYYMNDNHTFVSLPENNLHALEKVLNSINNGNSSGSLVAKVMQAPDDCENFSYTMTIEEVVTKALAWLMKVPPVTVRPIPEVTRINNDFNDSYKNCGYTIIGVCVLDGRAAEIGVTGTKDNAVALIKNVCGANRIVYTRVLSELMADSSGTENEVKKYKNSDIVEKFIKAYKESFN